MTSQRKRYYEILDYILEGAKLISDSSQSEGEVVLGAPIEEKDRERLRNRYKDGGSEMSLDSWLELIKRHAAAKQIACMTHNGAVAAAWGVGNDEWEWYESLEEALVDEMEQFVDRGGVLTPKDKWLSERKHFVARPFKAPSSPEEMLNVMLHALDVGLLGVWQREEIAERLSKVSIEVFDVLKEAEARSECEIDFKKAIVYGDYALLKASEEFEKRRLKANGR